MIRADEQGNLYILSDNSGYFTIKDIPSVTGKLYVVFFGDIEVKKTFNINGQKEVIVKLSKEDIENIGIGQHRWYADLQYGNEQDTIVYQTITIIEKDM